MLKRQIIAVSYAVLLPLASAAAAVAVAAAVGAATGGRRHR